MKILQTAMAKDLFLILIFLFTIILTATAIASILLGVPYVPTRKKLIGKLISAAKLKKGQKVYDLGCGDGRILFASEKITGVAGEGYEIAPLVYFLALIKKWMHRGKSNIHFKNFLYESLSSADVIFCYLTPKILEKLTQKLQNDCRKGTKIITHTFAIKAMTPKTIIRGKKNNLPTMYVYEIEKSSANKIASSVEEKTHSASLRACSQ